MPIHHRGIPHSTASVQGPHLTANEVQHWAHPHGIHWSCRVPYHEWWNGLLKTQFQHQLGDNLYMV